MPSTLEMNPGSISGGMTGRFEGFQISSRPPQRPDAKLPQVVNEAPYDGRTQPTAFPLRRVLFTALGVTAAFVAEDFAVSTSPAVADTCARTASVAREKGIAYCPPGTPRTSASGESAPVPSSTQQSSTVAETQSTSSETTPPRAQNPSGRGILAGGRDFSVTVCGTPTIDIDGDGYYAPGEQSETQRRETDHYRPTPAQCAAREPDSRSGITQIFEKVVYVHGPNIFASAMEAARRAAAMLDPRSK